MTRGPQDHGHWFETSAVILWGCMVQTLVVCSAILQFRLHHHRHHQHWRYDEQQSPQKVTRQQHINTGAATAQGQRENSLLYTCFILPRRYYCPGYVVTSFLHKNSENRCYLERFRTSD